MVVSVGRIPGLGWGGPSGAQNHRAFFRGLARFLNIKRLIGLEAFKQRNYLTRLHMSTCKVVSNTSI